MRFYITTGWGWSCVGYGADDVVVYGEKSLNKDAQKSFTKKLKSKSVRGGYSIIYDPVGDCFAEPALRSIGWGGTYLVVGFAAGKIPFFPANLMLLKGCAIDANGDLNVSGVSTFTGAIDANGDLDVDGHTELDNVNVSGVSTFTGAADFNGDIDVDGHTELDNVNVKKLIIK